MFIDEAIIEVIAGTGGSGCMSFHRDKMVARGGPDGGDGGRGGDVVLVGDEGLHTLMDMRYRKTYRAKRGGHGKGANKTGKNGTHRYIKVPLGTVIMDGDDGKFFCEALTHGEKCVVARGGVGGKGNAKFATSTNRAPRQWEAGREGEKKKLKLELKLIADIGLVGFPNAGKSTLISVMSSARPKIADYPFTTLIPNLGIVRYRDYSSFVMADIPGLIEGAHRGKGLGHRFLRHIERTRGLLFLIDITEKDPRKIFRILVSEIKKYNPKILHKPHLVVLTKYDLMPDAKVPRSIDKIPVCAVSAVNREGLDHLKDRTAALLQSV
ncbi:GTPase ObgE [candidate division KSB1 bacterium]